MLEEQTPSSQRGERTSTTRFIVITLMLGDDTVTAFTNAVTLRKRTHGDAAKCLSLWATRTGGADAVAICWVVVGPGVVTQKFGDWAFQTSWGSLLCPWQGSARSRSARVADHAPPSTDDRITPHSVAATLLRYTTSARERPTDHCADANGRMFRRHTRFMSMRHPTPLNGGRAFCTHVRPSVRPRLVLLFRSGMHRERK